MERCEMFEYGDYDIDNGVGVTRHRTQIIDPVPFIYNGPDVLYERWGKINTALRREAGHLLHISVFWWHILYRQQDNHQRTAWAVAMGLLDSNISIDMSLKTLHRIEILELILDTVEKYLATSNPERKAKELIMINTLSVKKHDNFLMKAVRWLHKCGSPGLTRIIRELGPEEIRSQILEFVFSEYTRYIYLMSCDEKSMLMELSLKNPDELCLKKSEEMKIKGNEQFQKKNYELAVKLYTKAIKYRANHHILYGNRALCYIRCEKYLKAVGDGKRAIVLQRDWAKGHYRFCDALFFYGARDKAVEANITAQSYCSGQTDGMRDLRQQHSRFMTEMSEDRSNGRAAAFSEEKLKNTDLKKGFRNRPDGACGVDPVAEYDCHPDKTPEEAHSSDTAKDPAHSKQKSEGKKQGEPSGKSVTLSPSEKQLKAAKSEMGDRKPKKPSINPERKPVRNKEPPVQDKSESNEVYSKAQFSAAVQEAHIALSDQRCRNAEQSFSEALRILGSTGNKLGLNELDRTLLIYGRATSLIEIGQPEELAEAQRQFNKLSSTANRTFKSLVHFGLGKVLLKENKFSEAKNEFMNALLMVQRQIMPGKLTWPTTKVTVEETCAEYLKDQLERFIECCKFPPKPDAVCRHCLGQAIIYFTDPDFKGFIRLSCCQSCNVEYHINCWKKFKTASFPEKNDKDFLQALCFTPDCTGTICRIVIFDSTGLIKCEFKSAVSKSKVPGMKVKQKCTSLKKLKSKEERKLRRKQRRVATSITRKEMEIKMEDKVQQRADKASSNDCFKYSDRVLQQLDKNQRLFNDETHNISSLLECLRPWVKLDEDKGHISVLNDHAEPRVLRELVDLLLERKNRVWARLFLHSLESCQDIKPKVRDWAQDLDNAGLKAAENFIGQFSDTLETLDLSSLLEFPPLHDIFHNKDFSLIKYIRQAPPQEMRLFIWTLEEYRDHFPSLIPILDNYFEMDAICLVLKKTEKDDNLSSVYKSKSKTRKKKPKEPKNILVLPDIRREEEDDFFFEEHSLMLFDDDEQFGVPDFLREQVAEFERQYPSTGHHHHNKRFLDNNRDPTKESLYDYFAQVLHEHGPLAVSDPLLVGELTNFPSEAQQKIEVAGGLREFLLQSRRFVIHDDVIALTSDAMYFEHIMDGFSLYDNSQFQTCSTGDTRTTRSFDLNPTAKEFLPQSQQFSMNDGDEAYVHLAGPVLPNPYISDAEMVQNINCAFGPVYVNSDEYYNFETYPRSKSVLVQTVWNNKDSRDDVAINTEPYVPLEKNRGDMTQSEKNNIKFEKQIQNLREMLTASQNKRNQACLVLDAEIEEINQHIEICNKELTLFQKKLEDEVRKDQQEKRDHQEMLKVLKGEIKELVDSQESVSKLIQDKNVEYNNGLAQFLEISNHLANEKLTLEDQIKKCQDLCKKATSRSVAAQVSILKNRQNSGLHSLRKHLSDGKAILQHLTELSPNSSLAGFTYLIEPWTSCVQELEKMIVRTEMQYEEQMDLVRKGTSLSSLPAVTVPKVPARPPVLTFLDPLANQQPVLQLPVQHTHPHTPYGVQQHPVRPQTHMAVKTQHARHTPPPYSEHFAAPAPPALSTPVQPSQSLAVFERILDRLHSMFPYYSRSVLTKFIQEVRTMNGGSLSMLKYEELINQTAQLILDHQECSQEQINSERRDVAAAREFAVPSPTPPTDSSRASATPPPTHVWKNVSSQHRKSSRAINTEDPCIICHEDMVLEDLCVLECCHSFHRECIRSWLKEQNTCPTCREHALLPEDFPMLPGRHRKGHLYPAPNF